MHLERSKSCMLIKSTSNKRIIKPQAANGQFQPQISRRLSMSQIKNRTSNKSDVSSMKLVKQKILIYIDKRSDVEIIKYYNEYKEQFFRKSISLQNLLYQKPEIRHTYLSEQNPHFLRGFQQTMLNLFRKKIIVPGSYNNMRQEAVMEIQKWVFSWIQRQSMYQNAREEQENAVQQAKNILEQIQQLGKQAQFQKPFF